MNPINLEPLLAAISMTSPAGEDLEYDPDFLALQQAAAGKPERRMGDALVPAEEPNWPQVRDLGLALLRRSKDLRIGVLLSRALLNTEGLGGLVTGLSLVRGLISGFWDDLHPRLDPAEGLDPTIRINILLDLCGRDTLLMPLRASPLIRSRLFGPLTYRDLEVAEGKAQASKEAKILDSAAIAGVFQECKLEELRELTLTAQAALGEVQGLSDALAARVQARFLPSLEPLTALLSALHHDLQARLSQREPATSTEGTAGSDASPLAAGALPASPGRISSQINSREEVIRTLDLLCDYYTFNEPASPVPLLLKRARRLVTGDFMDILRDLAPDALPQIRKICGVEDQGK